MSTKAPSSYNHLPLLSCSAVLARQLCGEPEPVCHCHAAEWEWALEATIEMNQIHHCLQGRGAEQHSLTHLGGGGPRWVQHIQATLLYENCIDFIIAGFCWPKYHQPCQKRAVECSWLFKLLGRCLHYQNNVQFWTRIFVFVFFCFLHNITWNVTLYVIHGWITLMKMWSGLCDIMVWPLTSLFTVMHTQMYYPHKNTPTCASIYWGRSSQCQSVSIGWFILLRAHD